MAQLMKFFVLAFALCMAASSTVALELGETHIAKYAVETTISSRFASTKIVVDVENDSDCATMKGFTFQLPINARVTSLTMSLSDGCHMNSTVKSVKNAYADFAAAAVEGKPAALLEAYDVSNYGVTISLPPLGNTEIEVHLEELLFRKRGKVDFQVPIFPGLAVDDLTLDISVNEGDSGVVAFDLAADQGNVASLFPPIFEDNQASVQLTFSNVPASGIVSGDVTLPRLLSGSYDAGILPAEGLLLPDSTGDCFVRLFNPTEELWTSTGSMPRNILFVIDISGSMKHGGKMDDAKAAFAAIIDKLTIDDYFMIHTFSSLGKEDSFGPFFANDNSRELGKAWVNMLQAGGSTNIMEAYLEALQRLSLMKDDREEGSVSVSILMVLTDGIATVGETNPVRISQSVRNTNNFIEAKIYGLAFGDDADLSLLIGIGIQNGGVATRIYEGFGDAATQMEQFYVGELGAVMLSDLNVRFEGGVVIDSLTNPRLSVLPDGSEAAVRARVSSLGQGTILRAVTTGTSQLGPSIWQTEIDLAQPNQLTPHNECMQSFAHAKIKELMMFKSGASILGTELNDWLVYYSLHNGADVTSTQRASGLSDLVGFVQEQALELAIEAGVVWHGLTAMVTIESDSCAHWNSGDVEMCYDGDGMDGDGGGMANMDQDTVTGGSSGARPPEGSPPESQNTGMDSNGGGNGHADEDTGASDESAGEASAASGLLRSVVVVEILILFFTYFL